jgi:small-conductance mechanosensitive channel
MIILFAVSSFTGMAQDIPQGILLDTVVVVPSDAQIAADSLNIATKTNAERNPFAPDEILKVISFGKLFFSLLFLIGGFLIIRFLTGALHQIGERSSEYRMTIKGFIPVVRIFGWIFIIIIIIGGIFQPEIATVITVTASVAIAIGFAAQDILKNMFGGIMILFDRPFQVGDKIQIDDHYGEVIEIGLRSTRIVTAGDSMVSIPNGEMMMKAVSNSNSGEANCQVEAEIFLPLSADTQRIRQLAIEAAQVSRYIYLNKPITVLFFNVVRERRSYLRMVLKAYVSDIRNEMIFKSDMTEIVIREILDKKLIDPNDLK